MNDNIGEGNPLFPIGKKWRLSEKVFRLKLADQESGEVYSIYPGSRAIFEACRNGLQMR